MKDLINWAEFSRMVTGDHTRISRTRIPKKYQKTVDSLIEHLEEWKRQKTGKTWRDRPDHVQQKFLEAEKEILNIPVVVEQSKQLCECDATLIRTGENGAEYCGICGKDLD